MRFAIPLVALAATGAHAIPTFSKGSFLSLFTRQMGGAQKCMSEAEAKESVEIYKQLIADFTPELGEKWVANSFVDNSDSINTFIHRALGGPTFPSKETFMENQQYAPAFPLTVLSVDAVQCNTVALQWKAAFGEANLPSKGLTIFKTVWEDDRWKISEVNVEFNALTWLVNMGGSYEWEGKTYTPTSPDPALVPKPADAF